VSRRGSRSSAASPSSPRPRQGSSARAGAREAAPSDNHLPYPAVLAERLRRIALGATAALVTARAFWPSESNIQEDAAGNGLIWILLLLIVAGLALASSLISGRFHWRFSWGDAAFVVLVLLVATSSLHAIDRRPALNLAWEWTALGLIYLLYRTLPRSRAESTALAGALVATALAVSVYGIYQAKVELPQLRAEFLQNPQRLARAMQDLNIQPGSASEEAFRNRILNSNEAMSTFGLANSLAVFIVGPLVLALGVLLCNLERGGSSGSRWSSIAPAIPLLLIMLFCLNLTKSRSADIGLMIGAALIAWQARKLVPPRVLIITGALGFSVVIAIIVSGLMTGQLDREVLTQTPLSLRYRLEYWQGTWAVITQGAGSISRALQSPVFWSGLGPGNFRMEYLKYKLPQASEEILDPHNLLLEVWATAGFWALVAALFALTAVLWNLLFAPSNSAPDDSPDVARPPARSIIYWASAGWALAVIVGDLNPFKDDLFVRWLILGASWVVAALLGAPLWRRRPIPASAAGAAILAITISLLASGGIGIPTVSLGLWSMVAIGLNLRDDRKCGIHREYNSRVPGFVLLTAWAAVLGTFLGTVTPFWKSRAAVSEAETALARIPPNYEQATKAYESAIKSDGYNVEPWLGLARMYWKLWILDGAKVDDDRWKRIPILLLEAARPPRNPDAWALHRDRALFMTELLGRLGNQLSPRELLQRQANVVEATRTASRLYPTNATLHARLADKSAEMSMYRDAVEEADRALELDQITPHREKKLPETVRLHLQEVLEDWRKKAEQMPALMP
jgi:O-antigen ligase